MIRRFAIALLMLAVLLPSTYHSNVVYFYHNDVRIGTVSVLNPHGYPNGYLVYLLFYIFPIHLIYGILSNSHVSYSNNLSISIYTISHTLEQNFTINTSTFNVNSPSTLIIVPRYYSINTINNRLAFNNIQMSIIGKNFNQNVYLVKSGTIINNTYSIPLNQPFYTVNVSWSMINGLPPGNYEANITLLVINSYGGPQYIYFWNLSITFNYTKFLLI
ncbi:MAG: hypothetical protein QXD10_10020 [Metallosphaera sp.]|uniref:hypothetical protein n=1 Tax=Metallosphaera sp. TaxID=2020860 RepID=UPI003167FC2D